jgi:hypothetical protein
MSGTVFIPTGTCWRCSDPVRTAGLVTDAGSAPLLADRHGCVTCTGMHGHDEHGLYAPAHILTDDGDTLITDEDCPDYAAELAAANTPQQRTSDGDTTDDDLTTAQRRALARRRRPSWADEN